MDEYDRSLPQAYPNMLCNLEKQLYTYYIIKEYGPHTSWMPAELIFGEKATHTCNKMKSDKTKSTPNHSPPPPRPPPRSSALEVAIIVTPNANLASKWTDPTTDAATGTHMFWCTVFGKPLQLAPSRSCYKIYMGYLQVFT